MIFSYLLCFVEKWWRKDKEIDIVALNDLTKEILFVECKWQSKVNAEEIFRELAKSFKRKINEYEGRKVYCIDLEETKKMLIL